MARPDDPNATRTVSRRDVLAIGAAAALAPLAMPVPGTANDTTQEHPAMPPTPQRPAAPFTVVLGVAQDGGVPQAGSFGDARWNHPAQRRHVVSLGLVDPAGGTRFIFDATPDFPRQLLELTGSRAGLRARRSTASSSPMRTSATTPG